MKTLQILQSRSPMRGWHLPVLWMCLFLLSVPLRAVGQDYPNLFTNVMNEWKMPKDDNSNLADARYTTYTANPSEYRNFYTTHLQRTPTQPIRIRLPFPAGNNINNCHSSSGEIWIELHESQIMKLLRQKGKLNGLYFHGWVLDSDRKPDYNQPVALSFMGSDPSNMRWEGMIFSRGCAFHFYTLVVQIHEVDSNGRPIVVGYRPVENRLLAFDGSYDRDQTGRKFDPVKSNERLTCKQLDLYFVIDAFHDGAQNPLVCQNFPPAFNIVENLFEQAGVRLNVVWHVPSVYNSTNTDYCGIMRTPSGNYVKPIGFDPITGKPIENTILDQFNLFKIDLRQNLANGLDVTGRRPSLTLLLNKRNVSIQEAEDVEDRYMSNVLQNESFQDRGIIALYLNDSASTFAFLNDAFRITRALAKAIESTSLAPITLNNRYIPNEQKERQLLQYRRAVNAAFNPSTIHSFQIKVENFGVVPVDPSCSTNPLELQFFEELVCANDPVTVQIKDARLRDRPFNWTFTGPYGQTKTFNQSSNLAPKGKFVITRQLVEGLGGYPIDIEVEDPADPYRKAQIRLSGFQSNLKIRRQATLGGVEASGGVGSYNFKVTQLTGTPPAGVGREEFYPGDTAINLDMIKRNGSEPFQYPRGERYRVCVTDAVGCQDCIEFVMENLECSKCWIKPESVREEFLPGTEPNTFKLKLSWEVQDLPPSESDGASFEIFDPYICNGLRLDLPGWVFPSVPFNREKKTYTVTIPQDWGDHKFNFKCSDAIRYKLSWICQNGSTSHSCLADPNSIDILRREGYSECLIPRCSNGEEPVVGINSFEGPDRCSQRIIQWPAREGIASYRLKFHKHGQGSCNSVDGYQEIDNTHCQGGTCSYTLRNLEQSTEYQVCIQASRDNMLRLFAQGTFRTSSCASFGNCPSVLDVKIHNITMRSATVSWDPVDRAENYQVCIRPQANPASPPCVEVAHPTTSYTFMNLQPGMNYNVSVVTRCVDRSTSYLISNDFTTDDICRAPNWLSVVPSCDLTAVVSWDATPGASGYELQYQVVGSNEWLPVNPVSSEGRYTISNLLPATQYVVRVRTVCVSPDQFSPYIIDSFDTSRPAPLFRVERLFTNSVILSWDNYNPNSPCRYRIEYRRSGETTWQLHDDRVNRPSSVILGLQSGQSYDFRLTVLACGLICPSPSVELFNIRLPLPGECVCPQLIWLTSSLTRTPPDSNTFQTTIRWTAVPNGQNYSIRLERFDASSTTWVHVRNLSAGGGPAPTANLESLFSGIKYRVQVTPNCTGNVQPDVECQWFEFTTPTLCIPPADFKTQDTVNGANLSWTLPQPNVLTGLQLVFEVGQLPIELAANVSSYNLTGLNCNRTYTAVLRYLCRDSTRFTNAGSVLIQPQCPCEPLQTVVTEEVLGPNSLRFTWSPQEGSEYCLRPASGSCSESDWKNAPPDAVTHDCLDPDSAYVLEVRRRCTGGNRAPISESIQARAKTRACPTIEVTNLGPNSAELSWNVEDFPRATGFEYRIGTSGNWANATSPQRLENLQPGTTYTVQLRARYPGCTNDQPKPCEVRFETPSCTCIPPQDTEVTSNTARISWNDGGTYEVSSDGTTWTAASGTSHTFSGLAPCTNYTLQIRRKCGNVLSNPCTTQVRTKPTCPSLAGGVQNSVCPQEPFTVAFAPGLTCVPTSVKVSIDGAEAKDVPVQDNVLQFEEADLPESGKSSTYRLTEVGFGADGSLSCPIDFNLSRHPELKVALAPSDLKVCPDSPVSVRVEVSVDGGSIPTDRWPLKLKYKWGDSDEREETANAPTSTFTLTSEPIAAGTSKPLQLVSLTDRYGCSTSLDINGNYRAYPFMRANFGPVKFDTVKFDTVNEVKKTVQVIINDEPDHGPWTVEYTLDGQPLSVTAETLNDARISTLVDCGEYVLTKLRNGKGCEVKLNDILQRGKDWKLTLDSKRRVICEGTDFLTLTASGAATYRWYRGDSAFREGDIVAALGVRPGFDPGDDTTNRKVIFYKVEGEFCDVKRTDSVEVVLLRVVERTFLDQLTYNPGNNFCEGDTLKNLKITLPPDYIYSYKIGTSGQVDIQPGEREIFVGDVTDALSIRIEVRPGVSNNTNCDLKTLDLIIKPQPRPVASIPDELITWPDGCCGAIELKAQAKLPPNNTTCPRCTFEWSDYKGSGANSAIIWKQDEHILRIRPKHNLDRDPATITVVATNPETGCRSLPYELVLPKAELERSVCPHTPVELFFPFCDGTLKNKNRSDKPAAFEAVGGSVLFAPSLKEYGLDLQREEAAKEYKLPLVDWRIENGLTLSILAKVQRNGRLARLVFAGHQVPEHDPYNQDSAGSFQSKFVTQSSDTATYQWFTYRLALDNPSKPTKWIETWFRQGTVIKRVEHEIKRPDQQLCYELIDLFIGSRGNDFLGLIEEVWLRSEALTDDQIKTQFGTTPQRKEVKFSGIRTTPPYIGDRDPDAIPLSGFPAPGVFRRYKAEGLEPILDDPSLIDSVGVFWFAPRRSTRGEFFMQYIHTDEYGCQHFSEKMRFEVLEVDESCRFPSMYGLRSCLSAIRFSFNLPPNTCGFFIDLYSNPNANNLSVPIKSLYFSKDSLDGLRNSDGIYSVVWDRLQPNSSYGIVYRIICCPNKLSPIEVDVYIDGNVIPFKFLNASTSGEPCNPDGTPPRLHQPHAGSPPDGLRLYPNPSTGRFTLTFDQAPSEALDAIAFDLAGRQVAQRRIQPLPGQTEFDLDLTPLADGVYLLQIRSGSRTYPTTRLLVGQ